MYKYYFEDKKVAIFDLESVIDDFYEVYLETFQKILIDLGVDWVNISDTLKDGMTIKEMWDEISKQPYLEKKIPYKSIYSSIIDNLIRNINQQEKSIITKQGFWGLSYKLKEENGFTLVLKSELDEKITENLMYNLDITDTFDLVIFQTNPLEPKNLYSQILSQIKQYKLQSKHCIAFEGHSSSSIQSANENILTIGIKGENQYNDNFSYKVTLTLPDYDNLIDNLDRNYIDSYLESHPNIKEKVKENRKSLKE